MASYLIIVSILFVICLLGAQSSQEQTSEGCGCAAANRQSSSAAASDDTDPGATPSRAATPACASTQGEKRTNQMVKIEGETFIMGTDRPVIIADGEGPARNVTVSTFWMDVHEVSNGEFKRFVDATGYVTEVNCCCILQYCIAYLIHGV